MVDMSRGSRGDAALRSVRSPSPSGAELAIVLATLIWGGTFLFIKQGLETIAPFRLNAIRFLLAAVLMLPFSYSRLSGLSRRTLLQGFWLGCAMCLSYNLQTLGLVHTTASRSGFLTYTFSLYVPFLQFFLLRRLPRTGNILGLVVVVAGLVMMMAPDAGSETGFNAGDVITLIGAGAFALHIILLDTLTRDGDPVVLTTIQFIVTGSVSAVITVVAGERPTAWSWGLAGGMFYLILFGSMIALFLMTSYQHRISPVKAVILYALEPFFALILAVILIGDRLSGQEIIGCGLIVGGILISELWPLITDRRPPSEIR